MLPRSVLDRFVLRCPAAVMVRATLENLLRPQRLNQIFEDTAQPGRFIEHFLVASWLEHQRQHKRVSKADAELEAQLSRFHRGDGPPKVEHFIAPRTVFFAS